MRAVGLINIKTNECKGNRHLWKMKVVCSHKTLLVPMQGRGALRDFGSARAAAKETVATANSEGRSIYPDGLKNLFDSTFGIYS